MASLRAQLEEARARAILEPTDVHVIAYLRLQQQMVGRASDFAQMWKQLIWQTPELDYEARHPQGHLARQIIRAETAEKQSRWLAGLKDTYGLIYIGAGHCPVCTLYGPLLKAFAQRHNLSVLAVSSDNRPIAGWPEAVPDTGQLARLGLAGQPVPLTVLFERATQSVILVGTSLISEDELKRRLYGLTAQEGADAF